MTEPICLRSLWQTLTAAASTCALFAAANWGMAEILHFSSSGMKILFHILVFAVPLMPLCISIANACKVRMVQSRLGAEATRLLDYRSIAIITLCPIYIQIPSALAENMPAALKGLRITMSRQELEDDVCPLELQCTADVTRDSDEAHDNTDASADLITQDSAHHQWVCLKLESTSFVSDLYGAEYELACRAALLRTGLAPKCKDLCILRARNRFQSLVTSLQAGGYVLSVLQRMVQHLAISPLEAIVTSLSIMVAIPATCQTLRLRKLSAPSPAPFQ